MNGNPFAVIIHLGKILRHLRRDSADIFIWVDAICINQNDLEERSRQVAMMTDIYSTCSEVVAWLGGDQQNLSTPLDSLAKVYLSRFGTSLRAWQELGGGLERLTTEDASMVDDILKQPGVLQVLEDLYTREWFERLWILQEATLGQRLVLRFGRFTVTWESFERAHQMLYLFFYFNDAEQQAMPGSTVQRVESQMPFATEISMQRRIFGRERQDTKDYLLWNLILLHRRACTDARDIIYSAIGQVRSPPKGIVPDYTKPVRDVYHEAAKAIIDDRRDLKLLSYCFYSNRRYSGIPGLKKGTRLPWASWPSWVPDWRVKCAGLDSFSLDLGAIKFNTHHLFDCSGSSPANVRFSSDSKVLYVQGTCIGVVQTVFKPIKPEGILKDMVNNMNGKTQSEWEIVHFQPPNKSTEYVCGDNWGHVFHETMGVLSREETILEDKSADRIYGKPASHDITLFSFQFPEGEDLETVGPSRPVLCG